MKRYAWFGAAAVLVAAGLWAGVDALAPEPDAMPPDMAAMPMLARSLPRADRIQIVQGGARLDLERRGQTWCLAQDGGYPVRPEMAQRLLDQLLALQLTHPVPAAKPAERHDDPQDARAGLTGIRVLAVNGAGLGAIIVADHAADATRFPAHPLGDPREWQAQGGLVAPVDPLAWIDPHILTVDPGRVTGAMVYRGAESFALDAEDAAGRLKMLEGLAFSDIHPAVQIAATPSGRVVFALADGQSLTVAMQAQADQTWLEFHASGAGVLALPPGGWLFRYPDAAAALLQPAS